MTAILDMTMQMRFKLYGRGEEFQCVQFFFFGGGGGGYADIVTSMTPMSLI